ncbi:hypothetical protein C1H76_5019 [Elsinoe australis]|uniref:Phosphoglycerate mutase n=1 Tax=Elsinoe australis TaxID=40998 RepID=A0A4U7AWS4_9PEZI|nr:hypothetical protein C1H76_5019 [Elsinoe australis]
MSDLHATTPRVFLARHGETEWTRTGQYTGTTDIPLTEFGRTQVSGSARVLVGKGKLVDPDNLITVFVSPRKRAQDTFGLLFNAKNDDHGVLAPDKLVVTEDIAEWDYGEYEGMLVADIKRGRRERGLDQDRDFYIWRDGCEGGESAQQVTERLDLMIGRIKDIQRPYMDGRGRGDIVLVAHGLILRAFVKRWLGYPLDMKFEMMLSPGGIGVVSYKDHNVDEPALFIGLSLPA